MQAKQLDLLGPDHNWLLVYEGRLNIISKHMKHWHDMALLMNVDQPQYILRRNIQVSLTSLLFFRDIIKYSFYLPCDNGRYWI